MTIETANRLYELRKKHNLSQEELAEKLGVSRQAVSKWERSEASPDTDNLIALAKIYDLSLDELIYGEKEKDEENLTEEQSESEAPMDEGFFIDLENKNERVKIGPSGITVESEDGEKVNIGFHGIRISQPKATDDDGNECDGDFVITNDNGHFTLSKKSSDNKTKFWLEVPYAVICAIAYLVFGFMDIFGGWSLSWIVFVTIPIYYSFVEAIYNRRFSDFAYPVLTAFIYLYLGLYQGNWHPSWIIFITIAIYYPIAEALDRKLKEIKLRKDDRKD